MERQNFVESGRNEQAERRLGQQVEIAAQRPVAPSGGTVLPAPVAQDDATVVSQPQTTDDMPLVAADDDLIEKEWVDKTKRVLAETKDDPYRREQEVKKLQIDYVKKRYGKVIGAPAESDWNS